uniref:Protein kinase domain-containing protein n=1 Tax=Globodera rostochiensis TaxID=31243 RepID=A0A914IA92_GLORO
MAALEIRMQQLRLPRELIYEQISFLPSADCRARRLLITNSLLHTAIAHGKNANNWRRPVPAKGKEAAYLYKSVEGINVRPLLPRIHTQEEHFPFPIGQFHKYAMPTTENSGILQYKMGVLLFIDEQIVPPPMTMCEAFFRLSESEELIMKYAELDVYPEVDIAKLGAHGMFMGDFVENLLTWGPKRPWAETWGPKRGGRNVPGPKRGGRNVPGPNVGAETSLGRTWGPKRPWAETSLGRNEGAETTPTQPEKEEASLFMRVHGTVQPLLPRIHTQGANRPFVIGDFNKHAMPTTENSGILQYKMGVLLFIDKQIVPPEMEPQARGNLCRHLKTLIPAFQQAGSDCVQIQENVQEEFAIVFLFFANPIGILRLGKGLDTILGAILAALNDMLIASRLVAILATLFTFSRRIAAKHQKSVYLSAPDQTHFESAYNAMDQCVKKEMLHDDRTILFALKFKLARKCVNAMLICYPGALDINATKFIYGMVPAIQFRVANQPGNDVAKKCAEKQQLECKNGIETDKMWCSIAWHGLRVSQPNDMSTQFLLELSITNKPYEFVLHAKEFSIVFGDQHSLVTHLRDEKGERINLLHGEDDAIRNAYLERKAQKEVHLSNYVGLWMLGLDFLPMHVRETMHMHVYRDCECAMHAWFIRPNENPKETGSKKVGEMPYIPSECANSAQNDKLIVKSAELVETKPLPVISGKIVRVMFRVNKNPKFVAFRLEDKDKHTILEMTISGHEIELVTKQRKKDVNVAIRGVPKNSTFLEWYSEKYLQVDFIIYAFFYEVKVGGVKYTRFFPWSNDWWTRANQTLDISSVSVSGDLYPDSAETSLIDDTLRRQRVWHSHVHTLQPLDVGDTVVFRGQVTKYAKSLTFYLTHNGHEINKYVGISLLILRFNFTVESQFNNTLEASYQTWDDKNKINRLWPFDGFDPPKKGKYLQRNAPFEIRFKLIADAAEQNISLPSKMYINVTLDTMLDGSKSRINLKQFKSELEFPINNIGAEGDLNIFTQPKIEKARESFSNLHLLLDPLLADEDSALFEGFLQNNATTLRIFFLHNTMEPRINDSNIPLAIIFEFNDKYEQNFMFLQFNATENNGDKSHAVRNPSRLFAGQNFKIEIRVAREEFKIYIHGAYVRSFQHKFPPWTVNCLRIDGDLKRMTHVKRMRGRAVITDLAQFGIKTKLPIVYRVPAQKTLAPGTSITIQSKASNRSQSNGTEAANITFNVSLLYEALETYQTVAASVLNANLKRIGRVVLHAEFSGTDVKLFERNNKDELVPLKGTKLANPIKPNEPFSLVITFHEKQKFVLHLDSQKVIDVTTSLPQWAIEYIRVDGTNLLAATRSPTSSIGQQHSAGRRKLGDIFREDQFENLEQGSRLNAIGVECAEVVNEMEPFEYVPALRGEEENKKLVEEKSKLDNGRRGQIEKKGILKRLKERWNDAKEKKAREKKEKKERMQREEEREKRKEKIWSENEFFANGSYGQLFLANTGNEVKTIPKNKCVVIKRAIRMTGEFYNSVKVMEKFQKLAEIKRKHIIEMVDYGESFLNQNIRVILMEKGGDDLRNRMARKKRNSEKMDEKALTKVALEMALTLRDFHQIAIHLDFKLDNLVYVTNEKSGGNEILKLIDFDGSHLMHLMPEGDNNAHDADHAENIEFAHVTPMRYKSPEQFMRQKISRKTDIWAFGVSLYEIIIQFKSPSGDVPCDVVQSLLDLYCGFTTDKIDTDIVYNRNWFKKARSTVEELLTFWDSFPIKMRLITNALHREPTKRLSAKGIVEYLSEKCELAEFSSLKDAREISIFNEIKMKNLKELFSDDQEEAELLALLHKVIDKQQQLLHEQKKGVENCDTKSTNFFDFE